MLPALELKYANNPRKGCEEGIFAGFICSVEVCLPTQTCEGGTPRCKATARENDAVLAFELTFG